MKIIEGKGDIARNEQCLLFPQCFFFFFFALYRIDILPAILRSSEIVESKLFSLFERVIKFRLTMVNRSYN